ncbi:SAM-dependent methyltransferase [Pseudonocardia endophytica]|uniref:S-adenosyl-L-methionine-dependent methyltransferase n=1 Tax=Pseudonocardia endophytica TaxID=401976 RepID=A0A4R1HZI0_PSEEN|nr:SAM-dependent methyltransferase [Pseudonocardia endophytica]TCK23022.1 methyltransferase (TIGR00027 family) [Pseudonocardia endophytica]
MSDQHEQWDIVSSIGFTALLVAAGRAVEGHQDRPLVDDPWAARFVAAAEPPSTVPVRPDQTWELSDPAPGVQDEVDAFWTMMTSYQGVRSRFFDTVLDRAVADGVHQVVLLAAGLDARALRLVWGPSVTVFEIDQSGVMEFKDEVVDAHDGRPTCDRRVVGVDLRDDWAAALRASGHDPSKPTAWLAEGLLPFLPADAQEQLLRTIDQLSAPGSVIAAEHFADAIGMLGHHRGMAALTAPFGVDPAVLASPEERTPAARRLDELGWDVATRHSPDVARGYGRELGPMPDGTEFSSDLVTATKG